MAQGRVFYFMALYSKPFLGLPDQVALLQSRGLEVTDVLATQECLRRVGYYRLSAYWYPFRVPLSGAPPVRSDAFLPASRFDDALRLYVFDKQLKMLVMDAVEQIEIAMRVELSLCLGAKGAFAFLNPLELHPNFSSAVPGGVAPFATWQTKMATLSSQSNEEFVRHFNRSYTGAMPIWMVCELWDFGMMSRLYSGLKAPDKQAVAANFGVANGALLESWLRALNVIRNIVAHHARLWNRFLGVAPALPRRGLMLDFDVLQNHPSVNKRVYSVLCVLSFLVESINPNSDWKHRVVALADTFPAMPHAKLSEMGFPSDWKTHAFWN